MRRRNTQRGSSILEYTIAATVAALLIVAAAALIMKFTRVAAATREVSEFEEARAAAAYVVSRDFDRAGLNLTRPEAPAAGTESVTFTTNPDYQTTSGTATRLTSGGGSNVFGTRGFGNGTGSLSFTCPQPDKACFVGFADNSQYQYWMMIVTQYNWWAYWVNYEGGYGVTAGYIPDANPYPVGTDTFQIAVENTATGRKANYYVTRQGGNKVLLYSVPSGTIRFPLKPQGMVQFQGGSIANASITGAPIVNLSGGQTEYSLMPLDQGSRLTRPVTVASGGQSATIISGDEATDIAYTTASFASSSSGGTISLRWPRRGAYQVGDVVDLIDFNAGRACLYRVEQVNQSGTTGTLVMRPVGASQPAWGRLSSDTNDMLYTFPLGTAVVKLAAPVTYSVTSDNRLVRMEGNRVTTAAFNVRSFSVTEQATTTGRTYSISITLASEGYETSTGSSNETRANIDYTSVPRALNLTANELN